MNRSIVLLFLAGCASSPVGTLRFKNQPPVTSVDDRRDTPKPEKRDIAMSLYYFDIFFHRRLTRLMEVPAPRPAADVNALDEIPDSTWFTNRLGMRDVSVDEIRRAPRTGEAPAPSGPWKIIGTKVGGHSPGLLVNDASGAKFIMKFDVPGSPDMETGADVVVQKLLWAMGYNTAEDAIVIFRREELSLAPNARVEDVFGNKRPMKEHDLDAVLKEIDRRPDGSYRALVSRYLSGVPMGGYARYGKRDDDPNDRIDHEERRSLRAQWVIFGWLDHTDVKEDNGLDMWVEDGARHYIVHYLVDFGNALGVYGWGQKVTSDGFAESVDFEYAGLSLLSLGLWKRPWEGAAGDPMRGVGRFESQHYDPLNWRDRYPYVPFMRADDADGFWAAKLIMRFRPEQIRAAVEEGKYGDPRAIDYLTRVLIERQRKTAHAWFERVNPLDGFRLSDDGVCFEDLLSKYFPDAGRATYVTRAFDYDGRDTGWHDVISRGAATCFAPVRPLGGHDGYLIIEIETTRDGRTMPPVRVHIARDPRTHQLRIIGIRRI